MSDKEKEKRKKWCIKQNGVFFKIDGKCVIESDTLRSFYRSSLLDRVSLHIKSSGIMMTALEFCKKRADIKLRHEGDLTELQAKLQIFDSEFSGNIDDVELIGYIDAAAKLEIQSMYNVLFDRVVKLIDDMTLNQTKGLFKIHYKEDDAETIEVIMGQASWPLKEVL